MNASSRGPGPGQVVAVYDANGAATLARDALLAAGIGPDAIHLFARIEAAPVGAKAVADRREAFWHAVGSMFARAEDPATYHLAADHKHAVVVVTAEPGTDVPRALQILKASGPVDLWPTSWPAKPG